MTVLDITSAEKASASIVYFGYFDHRIRFDSMSKYAVNRSLISVHGDQWIMSPVHVYPTGVPSF